MADESHYTDGPSPSSAEGFDYTKLPDFDDEFYDEEDIDAFAEALEAPENISPSQDDLTTVDARPRSLFITALNDWRPVRQRVRKPRKRSRGRRREDEARQGITYDILKWPLLVFVLGWLGFLLVAYLLTRVYIYLYEHLIAWRGRRQRLRKAMNSAENYEEWVERAKEIDHYLGNDKWKVTPQYAYYDCRTIQRVKDLMFKLRTQVEADIVNGNADRTALDELRSLAEACVKSNFVGFENPRLYSESYYGTKNLVEEYITEVSTTLNLLVKTTQLDNDSKRALFKHLHTNFGRTALCLSGGATFAYYHLGIAKALLDANLLPEVITGTSGGALIAALLCTRTDDELKRLIVPALAHRISACHEPLSVWSRRWWRTGARFDSVDWARRCAWFCRGSMTFREAYERTGRILNVSCVPSDPHSPTILANYLTSPDCVIWSAVLASAAVPGILNPVVLMKKEKSGKLAPYAFGHKWKDGSLRTDIPLKALNLHFNVSFSIVSQVNPHVNLFFFSSRGSVGRPVTHRRGRGWRGGFIGSATEQYLKLDLTKWLKVLRHLELLPRPAGQDWSHIWLQRFSGTITIWPKSILSDFLYILSDPPPERLARMIRVGQMAAWPKLNFIANRMKIERAIEEGRKITLPVRVGPDGVMRPVLEEEDVQGRLIESQLANGIVAPKIEDGMVPEDESETTEDEETEKEEQAGVGAADGGAGVKKEGTIRRLSMWFSKNIPSPLTSPRTSTMRPMSQPLVSGNGAGRGEGRPSSMTEMYRSSPLDSRRGSVIDEIKRQSAVFFDDMDFDGQPSSTDVEEDDDDAEVPEMVSETPTGIKSDRELRRSLEEWGMNGMKDGEANQGRKRKVRLAFDENRGPKNSPMMDNEDWDGERRDTFVG